MSVPSVPMYRIILISTFVGLLVIALAAAGLAWMGASNARYELQRTALAHAVLDKHLLLQVETYSLFKQLTDTLLSNGANKLDQAAARERLNNQIEEVRHGIAQEVAFVGGNEDETEELTRLAAIERLIDRVLDQLQAAEQVMERGGSLRDVPMLEEVLERTIDREFRGLIDAAIAEEQGEVVEAHDAADRAMRRISVLSQVAAGMAVLLCAGAILVLLKRLRRPLAELLAAMRAVAAGDLSHRVVIDGHDEFARVLQSVNRMIEDLEQSRNRVESARQQLEGTIAQRTGELAQANRSLEQADETRRRFLADISHELRTPLTIIRGEAEVTLRGRDVAPGDYKVALNRIAEQAVLTGRLVDDLLFVARVEAGEPRMRQQSVAFDDVVRRASADAEVIARRKRVSLECRQEGRIEAVPGDPAKLHQFVMILLGNAIRYSEVGGRVEASLSATPRGVMLRIADQGVGIADDEVGQVFERFYRGANAADRHADGSGLGLAMAKAIVEAHHGTIALRSRLDEGTVVTIALPAAGAAP